MVKHLDTQTGRVLDLGAVPVLRRHRDCCRSLADRIPREIARGAAIAVPGVPT